MKDIIYFDHASTSFPKPKVIIRAMENYMDTIGVSPGRSLHTLGQKAHEKVIETKRFLASFFNGKEENFHFTSNATAGLNLILKGYLKRDDHVITTNLEHTSLLRPLEKLKQEKEISYDIVSSNTYGEFDLEDFERKINKKTRLIAINHASNVIGTISPIEEIQQICVKHKIKLLVDATQTSGFIPINLKKIPADFFVFTGHKALLGPSGIGGVYIEDPLSVDTLIEGGTGNHSHSLSHPIAPHIKFEAGTANYLGIAGLGAALTYLAAHDYTKWAKSKFELIQYCLEKLEGIDEITFYGPPKDVFRLPILTFNISGLFASEVAHFLDMDYRIMVRPGLHCAPLIHKTLGTFPNGSVRISLGYTNTQEEIDRFIEALKQIVSKHKYTALQSSHL